MPQLRANFAIETIHIGGTSLADGVSSKLPSVIIRPKPIFRSK